MAFLGPRCCNLSFAVHYYNCQLRLPIRDKIFYLCLISDNFVLFCS